MAEQRFTAHSRLPPRSPISARQPATRVLPPTSSCIGGSNVPSSQKVVHNSTTATIGGQSSPRPAPRPPKSHVAIGLQLGTPRKCFAPCRSWIMTAIRPERLGAVPEKPGPEIYAPNRKSSEKSNDISQDAATAFEGEVREFVRRDVALLRR